MDPSPPTTSIIDLDPPSPKLEPHLNPAQASSSPPSSSRSRDPNSALDLDLGLGLGPVHAVPLRQLSPDPTDDLLSQYGAAAQLLLASYADKLRRGGGGGAAASSTAIVPVPDAVTDLDLVVARSKKKKKKQQQFARSGEMVRVTSAEVRELVISRDLVRRTRITYESLRSYMIRDPDPMTPPGLRSRPDVKAAALMKERGLWLNRDKRIIGAIPGIHIGDVFFYRMELCVVAAHGQTQAGIDYVPASLSASGEPIATSIVVSGGYEDDDDNGDVLIYTGAGGRERNLTRHSVDQNLERGNLALERSMNYGIEIRVIRGLKSDRSPTGRIYVYDGLYNVVECWQDVGKSGFCVYKYKLVRIAGQVEMGSVILKLAEDLKNNPSTVTVAGCMSLDISKGKEKLPVSLFNDIDDDREPLCFDYLVSPIYTRFSSHERKLGNKGGGCRCVSSCSVDCYCAIRNGGEIVYDVNGILSRGKPLVYECGPSCSCPLSCPNRVAQKGVGNRLEVFRSVETGWGVRSLDLIPAGSFICEFTGVVITKQEAEAISMNDASLIYSNTFPPRWLEWGDMSPVFPEYVAPDFPPLPELSFSMDVSKVRNVACYLSHSCSPNVFLQFVLFDHYNELYPHLMVFAMENIPPLRELSIDYGVG